LISWTLRLLQLRALEGAGFRRRAVQTSEGTTSAWEFEGEGTLPQLVVQHGISSQGSEMARLLIRLRGRFSRIIAPDFLGHGFSDDLEGGASSKAVATAYTETLETLLDGPALFFGNSLGGLAGIRFALKAPERLRGLMLCSPGGAAEESADELAAFVEQFRIRNRKDAQNFINKIHAKPVWYAPLLAANLRARLAQPTVKRLVSEISPEHLLTGEQLRGVAVPTALLWGRAERLMPERHRQFFVDNLPQSAVVIEPEGFGHCPHIDEPKALARVVVRWAESLS
jgi:pimeloyl-ACP methyl ester carboxylesterase